MDLSDKMDPGVASLTVRLLSRLHFCHGGKTKARVMLGGGDRCTPGDCWPGRQVVAEKHLMSADSEICLPSLRVESAGIKGVGHHARPYV